MARPLSALEPSRELTLQTLERFYRHPQRAFLSERLSLSLPRDIDPAADREPTQLDTLERYQIGEDLLGELAALPRPERARVLALSGRLPPGSAGDVQLEEIEELVEAVRAVEDPGPPLPDRDFVLTLREVTLVGRLDRLHEHARVEQTVATVRAKHKLGTWIRHLALCATGTAPRRTLLVGRKDDGPRVFEFAWVEGAREELDALVSLYQSGMRMPLPYLHEPAQALIDKLEKGETLESALQAASHKAAPGANARGGGSDGDDAHVRQVFELRQLEDLSWLRAQHGTEELGFADVAQRILAPLERHVTERA